MRGVPFINVQHGITPHYRSEGRLGDRAVFFGASLYYLRTFLICINKIMSFVPDDWMNYIVFVLPEEVKVCTLFLRKSELVKTYKQKYEILVGLSHICLGNIWNMFQLFRENIHLWCER